MHFKTNQTGRSMLEMLVVLAIVGVLSIVAVAGLTYAMNKHRANATIYDVLLSFLLSESGQYNPAFLLLFPFYFLRFYNSRQIPFW